MPAEHCAPAVSILTPELVTLVVVPVVGLFLAWLRKSVLGERAPAVVAAVADRAVEAAEERFADTGPSSALKRSAAKEQVRRVAKAKGIRLTDGETDDAVLAAVHRAPGVGKSGNGGVTVAP